MKQTNIFFKSPAAALLFSVFLGPVGLLYSSVMGGASLMVITFVAVCGKFYVVVGMMWMASCVWAVAATNQHNKKILSS